MKTSFGYLTKSVTLYILYLIFLLLAIDDVEPANYKNVVEGKPIDIECGKTPIKPGDKVTWSKDEKRDLKLLPRFAVNDNGFLHINETKKTDSGFYTCASTRKENGVDLTYTVNMYLNVECKCNNFSTPIYRNLISSALFFGSTKIIKHFIGRIDKFDNNDKFPIFHNGCVHF